MEYMYYPKGVCSMRMVFNIEGNIIKKLNILGGCQGNTTGVSKLIEGKNIDEVIEILQGIQCGNKGTSCPDQISIALKEYKQKLKRN